jgi:glycine oxidase
MRVVVVGAGLVGTAIARSLARRGAEVVVVEKGVPGAEASWAAGGILSPLAECDDDGPLLRLCLAGLSTTRALVAELADAGHDAGLIDGGTLDVAFDDDDEARLRARLRWQAQADFGEASCGRWLDVDDVRELVPAIGAVRGAAWFSGEASLDPRRLFAGLRATAQATGVTFVQRRVLAVEPRAVVVDHAGLSERHEADAVVVAAGAWTSQVKGADVGADIVYPVRGQMLEVQGPAGAFRSVVFSRKGYVVPRHDGRIIAGSTMERVGFEKALTPHGLARIGGLFSSLLPTLGDAPVVGSWAGLRPGTIDGLPLLGRHPSGVWIASGHYRNGVLLAAQTAALLTRAILDGDEGPLAPFRPSRCG